MLERNVDTFEQLVYGFVISLILYYVFVFCIRHTGAPNLRSKAWIFLHRRYVTMVCELDNNYAESLGSARIFSIIDKGGQAWTGAISSIFHESTRFVVVAIPTCFLLAQQSVTLIFIA